MPKNKSIPRRDSPVKVGQLLQLTIEGVTHDGEGVGKHMGFTVFVPETLPEDEVEAEVISTQKQYGRALLRRIKRPSPDRVNPLCPYYPACGGCQLMHANYQSQLRYKQEQVKSALRRIGGLGDVNINPIMGMSEAYNYRNKALFPIGVSEGGVVAGCYMRRSHNIVDVDQCAIQHPLINSTLCETKKLVRKYSLDIYNEKAHSGLLRHLLVRHSHARGETMVVFVINGDTLPDGESIAAELMATLPHVKSVQYNINRERGNIVLGPTTKLLRGREYILEERCGLQFKVSATSFFQVNPTQTEILYKKAVELASPTGTELVYDLYCGVGTMTLMLAQAARHVIGIEIVPEAVRDAIANAELNNIKNTTFLTGKAEDLLPQCIAEGHLPDTIVIDPPRAGCDEQLLLTIALARPKRLVYVSCNPATLARDLKFLTQHGFTVVEVQPVDMFPHTVHVECVVGLRKKG